MADAGATTNKLVEGPVGRTLAKMSAPIGIGMLSTFLFQVVDTYFVGQLGPDALAALSFSATTYFLGVALFMGTAVGVSALVGGALGAGDQPLARRYTTVALVVSVALGVALASVGVATIEPVFEALGAPPALTPLIEDYMGVLYAGMPLLIFGLVGSAAIRATGEVAPPEIILGVAGVINLVLDYVLIFGVGPFPELGIKGAALATVISWAFVFSGILVLLVRRRFFTMDFTDLAETIRHIMRLSSPAIATQILLPLTAMLVTYLAARTGPELVAAFGVAQRIETLVLVGISSLSVAVVPFTAQNYGAARHERVDAAVAFVGRASVYWCAGVLAVLVLFAEPIAGIFTEDLEIITNTKTYFYIVAPSYALYGILMLTAAIFNGIQMPGASLRVLLVRTFVFAVPLLTVGSMWGAAGIFGALSAANVLGFWFAVRTMKRALSERSSSLVGVEPIDDYVADAKGAWAALTRSKR